MSLSAGPSHFWKRAFALVALIFMKSLFALCETISSDSNGTFTWNKTSLIYTEEQKHLVWVSAQLEVSQRFKLSSGAMAICLTTMYSDLETAGDHMRSAGLLQTSIISTCSLPAPQRAPHNCYKEAGAGRPDEGLISFPVAHQLLIAVA